MVSSVGDWPPGPGLEISSTYRHSAKRNLDKSEPSEGGLPASHFMSEERPPTDFSPGWLSPSQENKSQGSSPSERSVGSEKYMSTDIPEMKHYSRRMDRGGKVKGKDKDKEKNGKKDPGKVSDLLRKANISPKLRDDLLKKAKFTKADIDRAARAVIATNAQRRRLGLKGIVHLSLAACMAAKKQAEDQKRSGRCSHTGADGSNPFDRICKFVNRIHKGSRATWADVQENCAYGQSSPEEAVRCWFLSSGHRKNMTGDRLAIGYFQAGRGQGLRNGAAHTMTFVRDSAIRPTV